jgi:hypothetical protein
MEAVGVGQKLNCVKLRLIVNGRLEMENGDWRTDARWMSRISVESWQGRERLRSNFDMVGEQVKFVDKMQNKGSLQVHVHHSQLSTHLRDDVDCKISAGQLIGNGILPPSKGYLDRRVAQHSTVQYSTVHGYNSGTSPGRGYEPHLTRPSVPPYPSIQCRPSIGVLNRLCWGFMLYLDALLSIGVVWR